MMGTERNKMKILEFFQFWECILNLPESSTMLMFWICDNTSGFTSGVAGVLGARAAGGGGGGSFSTSDSLLGS